MNRSKGWLVKLSFTNEFVDCMQEIYTAYGEEIFSIQGIANKHMDIAEYSRNFFKKSGNIGNVADFSVDDNANVKEKNVTQYTYESNKAVMKMNSLFLLHTYVREFFGEDSAQLCLEKVISGEIFVNDMTQFHIPYCYAFDLRSLMAGGMNFFDGNMKIKPPGRSDTFIALLIQTTAYVSNQIAGAASFPDFFPILDWYYRSEVGEQYTENIRHYRDPKTHNKLKRFESEGKKKEAHDLRSGISYWTDQWYRIKNQFQNFIYSVNFPFRGAQSPFTNISIMDGGFLKSLFSNYMIPDPKNPSKFHEANLDSTKELSKMFYEYFSDMNMKEGVFTFPVITMAISTNNDGKLLDPEFADWVAGAACGKAIANIFQSKPTSFSSCCRLKNDFEKVGGDGYQNSFGVGGLSIGCYDKETELLTEEGWMLFSKLIGSKGSKKIRVLTKNPDTREIEYQLPTDYISSHYKGNMHAYKRQGLDLLVTPNHNMSVTSRKTGKLVSVISEDLKSGYDLPRLDAVNRMQDLDTITIGDSIYNADYFCDLFGAYLGDGATYHNADEAKYRAYEISFQVSKDREIEFILFTLEALNISYNKTYVKTRNSWNIRFYSKDFWEFVQSLGRVHDKYIPKDFLSRLGESNLSHLLDGLLHTDGTKNGSNGTWFYSSSEQLADDTIMVCALLGIPTTYSSRKRKPSWIKRDQKYITSNRLQYEVKLLLKDKVFNRLYKSRKEIQYEGNIYCVEVPNHTLFVRRNGRTAWCGNSHRVAGVNMARLAILEKQAKRKGKNPNSILDEQLKCIHNILYAHRQLIKERIIAGYLPLYTYDWININKQYSTIGFVGSHEYVANHGMNIVSKKGTAMLRRVLKRMEDKASKWQKAEKEENNPYNIEQIPGESMSVRLAQIDSLLGYNPGDYELYSNQYIPLVNNASIYDRFKVQGELDSHTSGGAILHINVDDEKPLSKEQFKKLMDTARKTRTVYFAINYAYSECEDGHILIGKHDKCTVCDKGITQQYTRVVGFITPTKSWNKTRRQFEYPNRIFYKNGDLEFNGHH